MVSEPKAFLQVDGVGAETCFILEFWWKSISGQQTKQTNKLIMLKVKELTLNREFFFCLISNLIIALIV